MHRLQRQRFQDEHIERALDEITRLVWHKPSSPWLPGGIYPSSTGCQEEKTPKFMRKRPENSWRQANSQGIWRKFGAKTESNVVQKTAERPLAGNRSGSTLPVLNTRIRSGWTRVPSCLRPRRKQDPLLFALMVNQLLCRITGQ